MDHEDDVDFGSGQLEEPLGSALFRFADYLFDHFFLPCRSRENADSLPYLAAVRCHDSNADAEDALEKA